MLYKKIIVGVILFNSYLIGLVPLMHAAVPSDVWPHKSLIKKRRRPRKRPLITSSYFSLHHEWNDCIATPAVEEMNEFLFKINSGSKENPSRKERNEKKKKAVISYRFS